MSKRKRRRKSAPPRGYGALKAIEGGDLLEDLLEIRRVLHAGGEPMRDKQAQLFMRWRHWRVMRDDCEKRLKAGKGDKQVLKQVLKRINGGINEAWRDFGKALSAISDAQLHEQMAILCKATWPAVYDWQKAATEKIISWRVKSLVCESEGRAAPTLTIRQVTKHCREQHYPVTERSVRRFVSDVLKEKLTSEQGKRNRFEAALEATADHMTP